MAFIQGWRLLIFLLLNEALIWAWHLLKGGAFLSKYGISVKCVVTPNFPLGFQQPLLFSLIDINCAKMHLHYYELSIRNPSFSDHF